MLEAALSYLRQGFSVIPLLPQRKIPRISWTEYQKRRPTEDEVTQWWSEHPDDNIGIVTGAVSGLVVADIDPRHGGDEIAALKRGFTERIAKTGGGGWHLFYGHPGHPINNRVSVYPGVDIRGDAGYVVAPPSVHESGGVYAWDKEEKIWPCPEWAYTPAPHVVAGDRWVSDILKRGPKAGSRNDTVVRVAGYFARAKVPEDITVAILGRWLASGEQGGTDPWTEQDIAVRVGDIYSREKRKEPIAGEDEHLIVDKLKADEAAGVLEFERFDEFLIKHCGERVDWTIDQWLPKATIAFFVSPPGGYKSWLSYDLAISVAGGYPFLGLFRVNEQSPVLLLQQEDPFPATAGRLNQIFANRMPEKPRIIHNPDGTWRFDIGSAAPPVHILTSRSFQLDPERMQLRSLERHIRETSAKVVIIDPLYSITSAQDFMAAAARDLWPFKKLRDHYGVTFVLVAHTRKSAGEEEGREALWGSQFLNAFLETGWQVRPTDQENRVRIQRHFKVAETPKPLLLTFNIERDGEQYRVDVEEAMNGDDPLVGILRKYPDGATLGALELETGKDGRELKKRLSELRQRGLVTHQLHGKTQKFYAPDLDDKLEEGE